MMHCCSRTGFTRTPLPARSGNYVKISVSCLSVVCFLSVNGLLFPKKWCISMGHLTLLRNTFCLKVGWTRSNDLCIGGLKVETADLYWSGCLHLHVCTLASSNNYQHLTHGAQVLCQNRSPATSSDATMSLKRQVEVALFLHPKLSMSRSISGPPPPPPEIS